MSEAIIKALRLAEFLSLDIDYRHTLDNVDAALAARCIRACIEAAKPYKMTVTSDSGPHEVETVSPFIGPEFFQRALTGEQP